MLVIENARTGQKKMHVMKIGCIVAAVRAINTRYSAELRYRVQGTPGGRNVALLTRQDEAFYAYIVGR